jgi:hypothetical protein
MARIAIATASDGRDFVHEEVGPFGLDVQARLVSALRGPWPSSSPRSGAAQHPPRRNQKHRNRWDWTPAPSGTD